MWAIKNYCAIVLLYSLVAQAFGEDLRVAVKEVTALQDDEYICETYELSDDNIYINNFRPELNKTLVHHMLIYGCKVAQTQTRRNCFSPCDWSPSGAGSRIIYAWANEAPELSLPKDVSFELGTESGWKYIVIQMHYKDKFKNPKAVDSSGVVLSYQTEKTKFTAGIYLFAASLFRIQPHQTDVRAVLKCTMDISQPIYVFAVRVHAHNLGKAIGVFAFNDSEWVRVVERSPQRPQAFYPLPAPVRFDNGLDVAARCVFDSSDTDHPIGMGSTRSDEMCNAYLMFYTEDLSFTYSTCDNPSPAIPLPEPDKTELAFKGEGHSHGHDHSHMAMGGPASMPSTSEGHQHEEEDLPHSHSDSSNVAGHGSLSWKFEIHRDANWTGYMHSEQFPIIGQVGGVSKDDKGNLYVFHRGSRTWNAFSFDGTYHFAHKTEGPITENVIIVVAPNGTVIDAWGAGLFYMPHGITVCTKSNSIWLTDVALHQVFRYDLDAVANRPDKTKFDTKPTLTLGEAFEPGQDESHLCQPAGVATLPDGSAVIADGYCNSRLLSVSSTGKIARSIPLADNDKPATVVHAVVYDPNTATLFAADRENGRVFVVSTDNFAVSCSLTPSPVSTRIYGLAVYQPPSCHESVVIAFNQSSYGEGRPSALFFISPSDKKVLDIVPLDAEDDNGHAIVVDSANSWIYIGQITQKWTADGLLRFHAKLLGSCDTGATMESSSLMASIYEKNEQFINWISQSVQTPSSFVGLLVFVLSICVVIIISVLVCRLCRRSRTPSSRKPPRGSSGNGRDYAAQYSLLVGDAAVKRNGANKKNSGFEDLTSDEEDDDTIVDQRRLVNRPPGGGAKSRFVGFPPPNDRSPPRKSGDGDKIV